MKGPGLRINPDVRRVWECPRCGSRRKTGPDTVSARCRCIEEGVWMRLLEERKPVVTPQESEVGDPQLEVGDQEIGVRDGESDVVAPTVCPPVEDETVPHVTAPIADENPQPEHPDEAT